MKGESVVDLSHVVRVPCQTPWRSPHLDPDFCIFVLYLLRSTCKSIWHLWVLKVAVSTSKHWQYILSHAITIFESTCQLSRTKPCTSLHFYKVSNRTKRYNKQNSQVFMCSKSWEKGSVAKSDVCVLPKNWTYELGIPAFGFASVPETVWHEVTFWLGRSWKPTVQVLGVFEQVSVPLI